MGAGLSSQGVQSPSLADCVPVNRAGGSARPAANLAGNQEVSQCFQGTIYLAKGCRDLGQSLRYSRQGFTSYLTYCKRQPKELHTNVSRENRRGSGQPVTSTPA